MIFFFLVSYRPTPRDFLSSVGRTSSNPHVGLGMETPQLSGSDTELSGRRRISLEQLYVASIKSTGLKDQLVMRSGDFETFNVWL